ncbi:ankyrin repeat domain-containing protein [Coraliomargarita parva]|uniref:ankyrin repeat domain-containing protein n=1 Tax=Coraliomargarita parva TaxID=3014050 RepID=UPI0022B4DFBD|nr:ankyrin repeat domain-containing protein [Coraliomargarita parva]
MRLLKRFYVTPFILLWAACVPTATKDSLVGFWSIETKSVEALVSEMDDGSDEPNLKMAQAFMKMAASGFAVEFTDAGMRQIRNGKPSAYIQYSVQSLEGNRITLEAGGRSFVYTLISDSVIEFTPPGSELNLRFQRMGAAAITKLEERMEMAANGPSPSIPALQRFMWVVNASPEKAKAYLEKYPALISERDEHQATLLHYAAQSKKAELAGMLIELGADRTAVNANGRTPFQLSLLFKFNPELSKLLYSETELSPKVKRKRSALNGVLNKQEFEKAEFLFELGLSPDEGKPRGEKTAFLLAIENSELETAEFLLKHGADINHRLFANEQSALHVAARYASLETIQFLLDQGMSARIEDNQGKSPLTEIRFRSKDKIEATRLLVNAGADINERSATGSTLLSHALQRKDPVFAKELVLAGADFISPVRDNKSAYDLAKELNYAELLEAMDAASAE